LDNYTTYACYDFTPPSNLSNSTSQTLAQSGTYQSVSLDAPTNISVSSNISALSFPGTPTPSPVQAGGLLSFSFPANTSARVVLARFGVSFISMDQACSNAENEIPAWDFDSVMNASVAKWENVLSRVEIDTKKENSTIVELLYSSVC
jgi:putative alpha-1,2-mannosidase